MNILRKSHTVLMCMYICSTKPSSKSSLVCTFCTFKYQRHVSFHSLWKRNICSLVENSVPESLFNSRRTPPEWQSQIENKAIRAKSARPNRSQTAPSLTPQQHKTGAGEISIWANSPLPIFDWTISLMATGSMDLSTHLAVCLRPLPLAVRFSDRRARAGPSLLFKCRKQIGSLFVVGHFLEGWWGGWSRGRF